MSGFETIPGTPDGAVVLHVPHGSRAIPDEVRRRILLDDVALAAELDDMTDSHTGLIAARAAAAAAHRPWTFANRLSRLVVDPERFPDEREEMRAVGMGAVYTKTTSGRPLRADDPEHVADLLSRYFHPYALAMADLVDARLAATGRAVIIDVHSYPSKPLPYELHADGPRPEICLGTDAFHTPPWLLAAARAAFRDCGEVGLDSPFAGCYVPLRHYGTHRAVTALMIEIRRDVYMTEPGGEPTYGIDRVAAALAQLIDAAVHAPADDR
ncbi:MAG TPA: N-formylglutamate amidohydrolase [Actinocrinis sp.]|uniref:N-formylglutamate amidohydrolase n=1 Tax=Actinocrinis sp. TaxID=1920516 RepID=UPI002DDDB8C2|nr:N-formylglutamate amidohydrolase [Actinocrinis sp.]HEV3174076.1 N-formylglutamate amidohydrolase [Actinocrinis sp.]